MEPYVPFCELAEEERCPLRKLKVDYLLLGSGTGMLNVATVPRLRLPL